MSNGRLRPHQHSREQAEGEAESDEHPCGGVQPEFPDRADGGGQQGEEADGGGERRQEGGEADFPEGLAQGGEGGEAGPQLVEVARDDVHHIAHAHHENDGRQDHGHDVNAFAGDLHERQRAESAQQDDGQWNHNAPPGAEGKMQEGDEQNEPQPDKQGDLSFHDADVVDLGMGATCAVEFDLYALVPLV